MPGHPEPEKGHRGLEHKAKLKFLTESVGEKLGDLVLDNAQKHTSLKRLVTGP